MSELIPYIITFMIVYDLSIHLVYTFEWDEKIIKKKLNWWPPWLGLKYQIFWITYWGIALILMLIYIFLK